MSGTDITKQFEAELAEWIGVKYALGYCNGTPEENMRALFDTAREYGKR